VDFANEIRNSTQIATATKECGKMLAQASNQLSDRKAL
jgi:hypothetical protein